MPGAGCDLVHRTHVVRAMHRQTPSCHCIPTRFGGEGENRMKKRFLLLLIVTSLLAAACVAPAGPVPATPAATPSPVTEPAAVDPTPATAAEAAPAETGAISAEALRNATYSGVYDLPITLTDGLYEGEPAGEGDPARPTVEFIDGTELYRRPGRRRRGRCRGLPAGARRRQRRLHLRCGAAQPRRPAGRCRRSADRRPDRGQIGGDRRWPGGAGPHPAGTRRRRLLRQSQSAQDLRPAGRSTSRDHRGRRRPGEGLRGRSRRHELDPA